MSDIGNEPTSVAFLTDTFSGNGSTTAFTLSAAPATTSSILVAITGVLQDPSTYSVSGTTLTFSPAPPTGTSNISVRFLGIPASGVTTTAYRTVTEFTATSGQTTFSVPSYTVGFIDVYRNGVMLGSADYTATSGLTVVLSSGATAGDLVEVISFSVSSVLNAIPGTAGSVGTTYLAGGAVTQAKLASGVAGTGPAFSAALNEVQQSIPSSTWTKLQLSLEDFDTNSNYNTSTYRFTPTVAGYYQINGAASILGTNASGANIIAIYRNGGEYKRGSRVPNLASSTVSINISTVVYCNGSTDYIELYIYLGAANDTEASPNYTYLSGSLVRAA